MKLVDAGGAATLIQTVAGVGYTMGRGAAA